MVEQNPKSLKKDLGPASPKKWPQSQFLAQPPAPLKLQISHEGPLSRAQYRGKAHRDIPPTITLTPALPYSPSFGCPTPDFIPETPPNRYNHHQASPGPSCGDDQSDLVGPTCGSAAKTTLGRSWHNVGVQVLGTDPPTGLNGLEGTLILRAPLGHQPELFPSPELPEESCQPSS